jgi:hypothetical protein
MWNEDDRDFTPDAAAPTLLDRHAVSAAGYLLMAGMWLEDQSCGIRRNSRITRHGDTHSAGRDPKR